MKRKELLNLLEKNFASKIALEWDYVGLQVKGNDEINGVIISLDLTLQVIIQAIENDVNTIIVHHPLFFGEKKDLLLGNKYLKSKYDLLKSSNINVIVIHTNADFNEDSISNFQSKLIGLKNIKRLDKNLGICGELELEIELLDFSKKLKDVFTNLVDIRTTMTPGDHFKKIIIGSGASGDLIYNDDNWDKVMIIGELKHHEWVFATEHNIKVIEIGHFTEEVFKDIIQIFLGENTKLPKIIKAEEEHVFKTI